MFSQWAALSRADLCFSVSYLARFQSKPTGAAEACLRAMLRWLLTRLHHVQTMPSPGTYQVLLRNDATAAISISSMEGLLHRVRHIELRARYIQMLVKRRRLILEHIPGLENPSDGLTKSFKTREMLINLEREVGLVYGGTRTVFRG